jgi:hypothetical protein
VTDDGGGGHYNGLVLAIQKRLARGWSASTNFTVAKCLNNGEPTTDIGNTYPDPLDRSTNWGPCDSDRHYISNTSLILQSPGFGSGFVHTLTDAWQLGTVLQARTGAPLTPATTGNLSLSGSATSARSSSGIRPPATRTRRYGSIRRRSPPIRRVCGATREGDSSADPAT